MRDVDRSVTLLGLEPKVLVLVGAFLLVLLGGILLGMVLSHTDARVRALRVENRRLARALGVAKARNARLLHELGGGADLTAVLEVSDVA